MRFAPSFLLSAALSLVLIGCSDSDGPESTGATTAQPTATATAAGPGASASAPGSASATATSTATATAPSNADAGPAAFEGRRAMDHIDALAGDIGPRVAGSEAERAAAEYIRDAFTSAGYVATIEQFTFSDDPFRPSVVTSGAGDTDAFALGGSPGGDISGPAVFTNLAEPGDLAALDLTGKIAVADRGILKFFEKYENVKAAGAIGLIVINNEPGELLGNLSLTAGFPVIGVSQENGEAIREAARSGATLSISVPAAEDTVALNVVAKTAADDACEVIAGGHHDSVPGAPGALDNASGTATTLELARAMAADGLDRGLCFATFGAEESGLHGSAALVARLKAEGELPEAMLNLDMTGLGAGIDIIGSDSLTGLALTAAQELGVDAAVTSLDGGLGSDHQPFEREGVPVLFLTTDDLGAFHTPGDTVATIDPAAMERSGDLAYEVLVALLAQVARAQAGS